MREPIQPAPNRRPQCRAPQVVLSLLLAGLCIGPVSAAEPTPVPGAGRPPVTLTVWIMPNAPNRNEQRFLSLIQPFLKAHPHLRVDVTVLPWEEAWEKIRGSVKGGPAPDITQLGTTWTAQIASTGQLMELTDRFSESAFLPQSLATTGIEGDKNRNRRFGIPWLVDVRALYFNKVACAKAGVDPKKDFETWDSFKRALRKLEGIEVDGRKMHAFGMPGRSSLHDFSWWIWGAGGDYLSPDTRHARINSPESVAGIDFYVGLFRDGLMSRAALERNEGRVQQMLRSGEIATIISAPITDLPDSRFGVTLLPAGPRGRFTFMGGSTLVVYRSSKHPAEAVELIQFLAGEEAQSTYARMTGLLPAAVGQYSQAQIRSDPARSVFVSQMRYGRAYPSIPRWGSVEDLLRPSFSSLWDVALGQTEAASKGAIQAEMDKVAKQIDSILR